MSGAGERRRHPFSLDNGPDVVFMGQAEGYENVCSPAPPMLAGATERVSGQTASHAASTAEGDITTEGEEQWAVRMEAVPLQSSEANAIACRDRYMARKEASLRAELVRVHEVIGEMVSGLALLDALTLVSVVGMSMLSEVQEAVTAVLKALSTLMGSLTFQRGWFGFQSDVRKATAANALSSRTYSERTRDGDQAQASGRSSEQGAENDAEETRKQGAVDKMLALQHLLHSGHTLLGAAIDSLALFSRQEQDRNIQEKTTQRGDGAWSTYLSCKADFLALRKLADTTASAARLVRSVKERLAAGDEPKVEELHAGKSRIQVLQTHGGSGRSLAQMIEGQLVVGAHDKDRAADDALPSDRQQVLEEADGDRECSLSVTGKAETRESLSSHGSWNDMDVMRRVQSASPSSPLAMLRQRVPVNIGPDVLWSKLLKEAAWDVDLLPFLNSGTFNPDQVSDMREALLKYLEPIVFEAQSTIIRANTMGTRMFFVQSGNCQVLVDGRVRATRTRGDFIGEIALIYATERMADVVAGDDDVEVFVLSRPHFLTVAMQFPELYEHLKTGATERVRRQGWQNRMQTRDVAGSGDAAEPREAVSSPPGGRLAADEEDIDSLVPFADLLRETVATLPADHLAVSTPDDVAEFIHKIIASFQPHRFAAGDVIIEQGSVSAGLCVVSSGFAVIQAGPGNRNTIELHAGSHFGLITIFFSGVSLHQVLAGPQGATVHVLGRQDVTSLCSNYPLLQEALHQCAETQAAALSSSLSACAL